MVLSEVVQGGDAYGRVRKLIDDSAQTAEEKRALVVRTDEIFDTLTSADVIEQVEGEGGVVEYACTVDLPEDFALDQPLSPFLLAALELLDPESETRCSPSTSSPWPRQRWRTRGRCCARRSAPRATRPCRI